MFTDVGMSANITDIQFSPNGRLLAAGFGGSVTVWDVSSGSPVARVPQVSAVSAALAGDYGIVVVGGLNRVVGLWIIMPPWDYIESGSFPADFNYTFTESDLLTAFHADEAIVQVLNNPNTTQSFALTIDGTLYIYTPSNEPEAPFISALQAPQPVPSEPLAGDGIGGPYIALKPRSQLLAYAGSYRDVVIYDMLQNRTMTRFPLESPVACVMYNPSGDLLVTANWSEDSSLHITDSTRGRMIAQVDTGQRVVSCTFSPDGTLIATGDGEGRIALWGVPLNESG
jgi:WD40 repeat protein